MSIQAIQAAAEALDQMVALQFESASKRKNLIRMFEVEPERSDYNGTKEMMEQSIRFNLELKAAIDQLKAAMDRSVKMIEQGITQAKKDYERMLAVKKANDSSMKDYRKAPFWIEFRAGIDMVCKKLEYAMTDFKSISQQITNDTKLRSSSLEKSASAIYDSVQDINSILERSKQALAYS